MAKILLVEDDKSLREIYGVRLQAEGYEIVSAGDGEEALALAIKERPNLIVSDVMMPKISGFDMLDILRSTTETKDVKVIMMTALSSEDQRARGESLGADRYLVKSQVGIEDVVRTVHEVLGDSMTPGGAPTAPVTPPSQPMPSSVEPDPEEPQDVATVPSVAMPASEPTPPVSEPAMPPIAAPVVPPMVNADTVPPAPAPTPPTPPAPIVNAAPPASAPLPQPTAPFTSPAPASLGDQVRSFSGEPAPVYDPSNSAKNTPLDLSAQMAAELGDATASAPSTPPVPAPSEPPVVVTPPTPTPMSPADPVVDPLPQPTSDPAPATPVTETPAPAPTDQPAPLE